ncbi:unnamed protein product [Trichobilharzia szidati]|nr:unnamed protein product [Trichobilharzia szidati]
MASTSTCLLVTAFFLCTCESANAKSLWNKMVEVDTLILNYEGKIVSKLIKNRRRFKRFMKCQETYTAAQSALEVFKGPAPLK